MPEEFKLPNSRQIDNGRGIAYYLFLSIPYMN